MSITINGTTGIAGVDGSAATPSVQGTDTNTGVFFPAADTVALTTGGSERLRVDSSGNVGIGTSSPSSVANYKFVSLQGGTNGAAYNIFNSSGTDVARFQSDTSAISLYNLTATLPTVFYVNSSTEAMRISSSGAIGIGGANYGTSGQVLTSGGSGAAPSWASRGFASTTITSTSRASATVFQNTTNGTMLVTVVGQNNGAVMYAGATSGGIFQVSRQNATYTAVSCMVPPGWYYRADYSVLNSWIEGQ